MNVPPVNRAPLKFKRIPNKEANERRAIIAAVAHLHGNYRSPLNDAAFNAVRRRFGTNYLEWEDGKGVFLLNANPDAMAASFDMLQSLDKEEFPWSPTKADAVAWRNGALVRSAIKLADSLDPDSKLQVAGMLDGVETSNEPEDCVSDLLAWLDCIRLSPWLLSHPSGAAMYLLERLVRHADAWRTKRRHADDRSSSSTAAAFHEFLTALSRGHLTAVFRGRLTSLALAAVALCDGPAAEVAAAAIERHLSPHFLSQGDDGGSGMHQAVIGSLLVAGSEQSAVRVLDALERLPGAADVHRGCLLQGVEWMVLAGWSPRDTISRVVDPSALRKHPQTVERIRRAGGLPLRVTWLATLQWLVGTVHVPVSLTDMGWALGALNPADSPRQWRVARWPEPSLCDPAAAAAMLRGLNACTCLPDDFEAMVLFAAEHVCPVALQALPLLLADKEDLWKARVVTALLMAASKAAVCKKIGAGSLAAALVDHEWDAGAVVRPVRFWSTFFGSAVHDGDEEAQARIRRYAPARPFSPPRQQLLGRRPMAPGRPRASSLKRRGTRGDRP
jgi:hypothetical protein